jgi:hypothetical protein
VAAPAELEQIIRDELRQPVSELVERVVRELVRESLNGAAPAPVESTAANGLIPATKVCRTCEREKPADQFGKARRICKACRREQGRSWEEQRVARRRMEVDDDEEGP